MLPPGSGLAPKQAVVLLHGYGSDGQDLIGLAPHWQPILPDALFVAPNAPTPCENFPAGYQWFAPNTEGSRLVRRQEGVVAARPVLAQFLDDLWNQTGLTAGDTILAGFSQGAMMALHVGLSLREPPMGILAFSGAFLPPEGFGTASAYPPVALIHGDMDTMVDPACSVEAEAALKAAGVPVRHHVSRGTAHGIAPDGLAFASAFIAELAAKQ
jgi:phospholipase/carboxylesterase